MKPPYREKPADMVLEKNTRAADTDTETSAKAAHHEQPV